MEFFRVPDRGIGFSVDFHFYKGYRNPHTTIIVTGICNFRFLPTTVDLFEFDPATMMLAHAFSPGLFPQYQTAEDLYNDNVMFLEIGPIISQQAVFAGVDRNSLMPEVAMRESALDPKLREMYEVIRQFSRNTMYSFRRGTTKETVI